MKLTTLFKFGCIVCLSLSLLACGKKNSAPKDASSNSKAEVAKNDAARKELVTFGSNFLPTKFYNDPPRIVSIFNKPGAQKMLVEYWKDNLRSLKIKSTVNEADFSIVSRPFSANTGGIVFITMPYPENAGEPYFGAMLVKFHKVDKGGMEGEAQYYVLEKSEQNNARLYLIENGEKKLKGGDVEPSIDSLWNNLRQQVQAN